MAARDKVLEAAAELVPVEPPSTLVDSETRRRVEDLAHRLSHQGATLEQYLEATGQEPRRSSTRSAWAPLAQCSPTWRFVPLSCRKRSPRPTKRSTRRSNAWPSAPKQKPARVRRELEQGGALETVRSDVARGKALEFLVDHATLVDEAGNAIDMSRSDTSASEATSVDESTPAEHEQQESED